MKSYFNEKLFTQYNDFLAKMNKKNIIEEFFFHLSLIGQEDEIEVLQNNFDYLVDEYEFKSEDDVQTFIDLYYDFSSEIINVLHTKGKYLIDSSISMDIITSLYDTLLKLYNGENPAPAEFCSHIPLIASSILAYCKIDLDSCESEDDFFERLSPVFDDRCLDLYYQLMESDTKIVKENIIPNSYDAKLNFAIIFELMAAVQKHDKSKSIIIKKDVLTPNDKCSCGSGKKYKKCCMNK